MKRVNNEQGAALVIVLGIIMLIMVFGSVLASQMSNTQQQLRITKDVIDARNISKMALDRTAIEVDKAFQIYQEAMNKAEKNNSEQNKINNAKNEAWSKFKEKIGEIPSEINVAMHDPGVELDSNHFYQISSCSVINRTVNTNGEQKTKDYVEIKVKSRAYEETLNDSNLIPINR